MVAPYRFKSAAELIGTWPMVPHPVEGYSDTHLLTGNLIPQARILGTIRSDNGYEVQPGGVAGSFKLDIDGAEHTIVFDTAGNTQTLQEVIDEINMDTSHTVAYDDNNFLLLKSPTPGADSYLKVIPVDGDEYMMAVLGLTANSESFGGDISSTSHIDPTRQVGTHGQIAPNWGENLTVDNFNRLAMQLAMDSERVYGLVARKRLAVRKEVTIDLDSVTVDEWQLAGDGVGLVYMGPTAAPDADHLEDYITILDLDHNEYTVEKEYVEGGESYTDGNVDCEIEDDTGNQLVTLSGHSIFHDTDPENDYYVKLTGLSGISAPSVASGMWKILEYRSATQVVISCVTDTGVTIVLNGTSATGDRARVQIQTVKVRALGFYSDATCDTRAEHIQVTRATEIVTQVERNNRVYCETGDFITDGVVAGDLVFWDDAGNDTPFSNFTGGDPDYAVGGTPYHVLSVLDAKTLELAGNDFGPVMLNAVGTLGEITIKSDGDFLTQPFVKFEDPLAVPSTDFIVVYMGSSTLQDTSSDVAAFAGSVRYSAETSSQVQKAILGIVGPSVDSMTDALAWLYQDRRNNLENTINQLGKEHYRDDSTEGGGRHSIIRPDKIDMFPAIAGDTFILRSDAADTVLTYKQQLKNNTGNRLFYIDAFGGVGIGDSANGTSSYALNIAKSTGAAKIKLFTSSGSAGIDMLATGSSLTNVWTVNSGTISTKMADDGGDYIEMLLASGATHMSFNGYRSAVSYPDALVVTSGGRVGVGLTNPSSAFHVKNRTSAQEWMALENYEQEAGYLGFYFHGYTATCDGRIGFLEGNDNFGIHTPNSLYIVVGDNTTYGNDSIIMRIGTGGTNELFVLSRTQYIQTAKFKVAHAYVNDVNDVNRFDFTSDGDDGLMEVRCAGSNIDLSGTQFSQLETWADLSPLYHFVIRGLGLVSMRSIGAEHQLRCGSGVWFCAGKVYNLPEETGADCDTEGAYLDAGDSTTGWKYAFLSTAGVVKLGRLCPSIRMQPNGSESMTGSGDTDPTHWIYLGSFYYHVSNGISDFVRAGDMVYCSLPAPDVTVDHGSIRTVGTNSVEVSATGLNMYPHDAANDPHTHVTGLIITGGASFSTSSLSGVTVSIGHYSSSEDFFPAYDSGAARAAQYHSHDLLTLRSDAQFDFGQLVIWGSTDADRTPYVYTVKVVVTAADLQDDTSNDIKIKHIGYVEPLQSPRTQYLHIEA